MNASISTCRKEERWIGRSEEMGREKGYERGMKGRDRKVVVGTRSHRDYF
tara:strand:+ start:1316 stop:1465 length:150 start_codon:yes stop_codon:yes gene_type:complete